nr:auxin response factor 2-like isoform X1 [Ipomoea batatas]
MRFEGEEAPEQRFIGTIVGIEDHDPHKWPESKWRCLKVQWDETSTISRPDRVSPWKIEPTLSSSSLNQLICTAVIDVVDADQSNTVVVEEDNTITAVDVANIKANVFIGRKRTRRTFCDTTTLTFEKFSEYFYLTADQAAEELQERNINSLEGGREEVGLREGNQRRNGKSDMRKGENGVV